MERDANNAGAVTIHPGLSAWQIAGMVVLAVATSTLITLTFIYFTLFQKEFKPVTLNTSEQKTLAGKLNDLGISQPISPSTPQSPPLTAERYTENAANREIVFSERELNALLANSTDLAHRLAIDLSDDLASAKLLVTLEEDFPFLGGKTVKVTTGLELAYSGERPIIILRGISIMGVPMPNAWLGNIKNVDLVAQYGHSEGFWHALAAGIDDIRVEHDQLRLRLKE